MKRIAVIPARSGSKRIPGKNTKIFCGKPMLAYSIEAALASGVFDMVMVSTDSEQTAEISIDGYKMAEIVNIMEEKISDKADSALTLHGFELVNVRFVKA